MSSNFTKKITKNYARALILISPIYKIVSKVLNKPRQGFGQKRIILLISRPQDVELLIGLHEKALHRQGLNLTFWVVDNCVRRYPEVLTQLKEKKAVVAEVVSHAGLAKVLKALMRSDVFLSTVESSTAKNKLPYIITRLANKMDVETYTLQHGFPNLGLSFCDHVYGPNIKFAAKTVLTWGPIEALPSWVSKETRNKSVAVGCPKKLVLFSNDLSIPTGERPIIGVFENLHGHIFNKEYVMSFLSHLQETARLRKDLRFILKPHPASLRLRSKELQDLFNHLEDVEIAGSFDEETPAYTTPWLLSNAAGIITTPSTIALDGAMLGVPVAMTLYGLDLFHSLYSPLVMLENREDWESFLCKLKDGDELKRRNEEFLGRVIVPGDAASRILDLMTVGKKDRVQPAV
jgi:hypothetical protein